LILYLDLELRLGATSTLARIGKSVLGY